MARVLCAQQITHPNSNTKQPDTLFIVEIGVNTPPKLIFEKGSPNNVTIKMTSGAKYYKITSAGQPASKPAPGSAASVPVPVSASKVPATVTTPAAAAAASVAVSKAPESVAVSKASASVPTPATVTTPAAAAAAAAAASVAVSKAPESALAPASALVTVPTPATATTPAAAAAASVTESKVQVPGSAPGSAPTPTPTPQALAPPTKVCGLVNPSVLCYANSAIQLLLDIPEIPAYFKDLTDDKLKGIKYIEPLTDADVNPLLPERNCDPLTDEAKQTNTTNIRRLREIFKKIADESVENKPTSIIDVLDPAKPSEAGTVPAKPSEAGTGPSIDNAAYSQLVQNVTSTPADFIKPDGTAAIELAKSIQEVNKNKETKQPEKKAIIADYTRGSVVKSYANQYTEAGADEFLRSIFFPVFTCVDDPTNFTKLIGTIQSTTNTCENNNQPETKLQYDPMVILNLDNNYNATTTTTIKTLLTAHTKEYEISNYSELCGTLAEDKLSGSDKKELDELKKSISAPEARRPTSFANMNGEEQYKDAYQKYQEYSNKLIVAKNDALTAGKNDALTKMKEIELAKIKTTIQALEKTLAQQKRAVFQTNTKIELAKNAAEIETLNETLAQQRNDVIETRAKLPELYSETKSGNTPWTNYFEAIENAIYAKKSYMLEKGLAGKITATQNNIKLQNDTKYIIINLPRIKKGVDGVKDIRNEKKVEIDKEITIDSVRFRRKGCIFHVGTGEGGHYVYGSYDKDGEPNHVRDDNLITYKNQADETARINAQGPTNVLKYYNNYQSTDPNDINIYNRAKPNTYVQYNIGVVNKTFDYESKDYLATLCLYERIDPQAQTQTQPNKGGSTKTKKRKHKNKKRKTQHTKRN